MQCMLQITSEISMDRITPDLEMRPRQSEEFKRIEEGRNERTGCTERKRIFAPILVLPRKSGRLKIGTDAYNRWVWIVLMQDGADGARKAPNYWACDLTKAELNNDKARREYLAVVYDFYLLRPYLEDKQFTVYT